VWIKWMELRAHGEADAMESPTGMIPLYEDLQRLFKETLDKALRKLAEFNKEVLGSELALKNLLADLD